MPDQQNPSVSGPESWQRIRHDYDSPPAREGAVRPIHVLLALIFLGVSAGGGVFYREQIVSQFNQLANPDRMQASTAGSLRPEPRPADVIPPNVRALADPPSPVAVRPAESAARTVAPSSPGPTPIASNSPQPLPSVQRPGMAVSMPAVITPTWTPPDEPIGHKVVVERNSNGHFELDAKINDATIRLMFDTGATLVALRAEDAERMGIDLNNLNYSLRTNTANGTAAVAPYTIKTLTIGNITAHDVKATVARRGALSVNLLGQSFMTQLRGHEVEGNRLTLRGR